MIRRQACWSWFAGGYHTYGNGNVWHFDTCKAELTQPWKLALHSTGAATLKHVKAFLEEVGWWDCFPDPSVFAEGQGCGATLNVALRRADGQAIAVYLATPAPVRLRLDGIAAAGRAARWVDPATGEAQPAGITGGPTPAFTPPTGWNDALLHVYAAAQGQP